MKLNVSLESFKGLSLGKKCVRIAKSVGGHGRVRYFGSSIGWV